MSIANLLRSRLVEDASGTAAVDLSGRRISVTHLDSVSTALAERLAAMAGPGLVVTCFPNQIEAMVAAFAVFQTQHALLMVHPELPESTRIEFFREVRPVAEIVQRGTDLHAIPDPYGAAQKIWCAPRSWPEQGVAFCTLTSGSTGRPRLIAAPHEQVTTAVGLINRRLQYQRDDIVAVVPPLSFDYGLYQLLLATAARATVLLDPRLGTVQGLTHSIARAKITVLPVVPTTLRALTGSPLTARIDTSRVRLITTTGDLLTELDIEAARSSFPAAHVVPMYGLSECKRVAITPIDSNRPPGAVGVPLDCTDVVVDGDELIVAGRHLTLGYLNDATATADRFTVDRRSGLRLLHTGDRLSQDDEGWLHWIGRDSETIKTSGYRIAASELETAAAMSGVVVESGAYGRPDSIRGQTPGLTIRLRPDAGRDDAIAVVRDTLRQRLPTWAVPMLEISDVPLPRTRNGKIDRAALAGDRVMSLADVSDTPLTEGPALTLGAPGPVSRQLINCHTQAFLSAFKLPYDLTPVDFESLTTLPFGVRANVDDPQRLLMPYLDPDVGLDRACGLLGLSIETVWHDPDQAETALSLLDRWLLTGPVLLGPLDLGELMYQEVASTLRGCDHYLVALGRDAGGMLIVRDPEGFLHAELDDATLLSSWAADSVLEGRGAFTLRRIRRGVNERTAPPDLVDRVTTLGIHNLVAASRVASGGPAAYWSLGRLPMDATRRRALSLLLPPAANRYAMAARLARLTPSTLELGTLLDEQTSTLAQAHGDVIDGGDPRGRFDEAADREARISRSAVALSGMAHS